MAKYLCIWVRAYWFSVTSFSKWLPGGHIRFFGFWMAWFRQRNSSLLWNFSFKFHVHVLFGCRQKPNDCQLCRFQNSCLVILNNATLSYGGGGILVDHGSTISSLFCPTDIGGPLMPAKVRFTSYWKIVRGMDMNLVLWIWSTRTRTQTKILVLVLRFRVLAPTLVQSKSN